MSTRGSNFTQEEIFMEDDVIKLAKRIIIIFNVVETRGRAVGWEEFSGRELCHESSLVVCV